MLIVFRRSADTYLLPACLRCIFHVLCSWLYGLGSVLLALYSSYIGKFFLFRALITTSANHGI